ncbi:hypothetical protein P175DRAFT_0504281 [Aspergillus ochraceoroseus IBT 24754]|uniref:Uncharacterized protein n=2 Tax=Aspergillus ochraceoroseus TaxID=138278 RepID=A0A2T5LQ07_9EURO|nr:uncharacterized protein P175DRAFT_0504281 [Aspergillus ochraceoroseus IBT 24754]KKK14256.1 hypothetical protein AOCH_001425 [Aspergillus ochraceoroseus]PTU18359.1 hypothetical protein P175DRAFT_0504281 [Aspergillus ochraceoroseus IBT 24754]
MFDLEDDDASRREKCYTTVTQLPHFIDPKQPPTKRPPFPAILSHPFIHTVEVILPMEGYSSIESSLDSKLQKLQYARVSMTLSSIIHGEFFNTYIKSGNILMISEAQSSSENVFTLRDGVLRLELAKECFERTGFTGKPVRTGGKKHTKERYLVEINLRLPSMLHGKKGFQRIEWAFKNVLNTPVSWLFFDLGTESKGIQDDDITLKGNHPEIISRGPSRTTHRNISTPSFHEWKITEESLEPHLKDSCGDIAEWLAMVSLESGRVSANDDIDSYLSRYDAPEIGEAGSCDLVSLKWRGFIPPKWITQLFITLCRETTSQKVGSSVWFSLSASALGRDAVESKDGYTIMVLPPGRSSCVEGGVEKEEANNVKDNRNFVCWEYVGASTL